MNINDLPEIKNITNENGLNIEILFLCKAPTIDMNNIKTRLSFGLSSALATNKIHKISDITCHHKTIGTITTSLGPRKLFNLLQAINWKPNKEMRELIGNREASMGVGDCFVVNGVTFYCDCVGFKNLTKILSK